MCIYAAAYSEYMLSLTTSWTWENAAAATLLLLDLQTPKT